MIDPGMTCEHPARLSPLGLSVSVETAGPTGITGTFIMIE
jgi:hypothetical protein